MRQARDQRFADERAHYELRHCCEDCALFDVRSRSCAHEWPTESHRRAYYEEPGLEVDFCKEFELA